jgi:hypothetical protein
MSLQRLFEDLMTVGMIMRHPRMDSDRQMMEAMNIAVKTIAENKKDLLRASEMEACLQEAVLHAESVPELYREEMVARWKRAIGG